MSKRDLCPIHGANTFVDCWNCGGDGFSGHECGDDTCACFEPEDNVRCDICRGKGTYPVCLGCNPAAAEDVHG